MMTHLLFIHRLIHSMHKSNTYRQSHFAPAFFFLSAERRHALKILYGVCRLLDDVVDCGDKNAPEILAAWKQALNDGKVDGLKQFGHDSLAEEFVLVSKIYDIPLFSIIDLIDKGLALDLSPTRFHTPMELESYCYGVAGTVGIACLPIFGVPWLEAKNFAVRLGVAIQWINIIRDVGVDAKLGRVYLPQDHLEQFNCTSEEILKERNSSRLQALLSFEAGVARSHYARAMELLPAPWRKELKPARIMGEIYLKLLHKIEKKGFPIFEKKVTLSPIEKLSVVVRAVWS